MVLLVGISLVVGVWTLRDYGVSWDEPGNYMYGQHSLLNYYNLFHGLPVTPFDHLHLDQKGPAFFMLSQLLAQLFVSLVPSWSSINGIHLAYFLTFQAAVVAMYFLSRRWIRPWAAFGTTALFATQPVIWGHAFMNAKDTPFMAFFLISVTVGLYTMDHVLNTPTPDEQISPHLQTTMARAREDWRQLSPRSKRKWGILSLFGVLLGVLIFLAQGAISALAVQMVSQAYYHGNSPIGKLFGFFANSAQNMPLGYYIDQAQALSGALVIFVVVLIVLGIILGFILTLDSLRTAAKSFLRALGAYLVNPRILVAAILLGATVSIRVLGPLAGCIVAFYALARCFKRAAPSVTAYAALTILVAYLTWPYLWFSPIGNFVGSLDLMSKYVWTLPVLFNGTFYTPDKLPRFFLPEMFAIQLTEPVLVLLLVGLVVILLGLRKDQIFDKLRKWMRRKADQGNIVPTHSSETTTLPAGPRYFSAEFAGLVLWFALPVAAPVFFGSTVYDNFRQFIFVLPPLLLIAGIGLNAIFSKWNNTILKVIILLAVIAPGVYAGVRLHPYEYVYYNSLVGGTGGAYRKFELDYWVTSYEEAGHILNQIAPPNARVIVFGPDSIINNYTRPDIKLVTPQDAINLNIKADYYVSSTRWNFDVRCPGGKTVAEIGREGAVFTVIKQLTGNMKDCP